MNFHDNNEYRNFGAYSLLGLTFVLFIPILDGWNFFYGHIFFILWVTTSFLLGVSREKNCTILLVLFLIGLFLSLALYHVLEYGIDHRFIQDSFKFDLLVIVVLILSTNSSLSVLLYFLKVYIYTFPFVFSGYFFLIKDDDFFQYSGRLYDPLFGSPNTAAVFCGLSILYIFCFFKRIGWFFGFLLLVFYGGVFALSFSRAAALALIFSLVFIIRLKHIPIILIFLFFIVIPISLYVWTSFDFPAWVSEKANLISDLKETGGSYRLQVWIESINTSFSSINMLLFGQGPGRVVTYLFGFKLIDHPHNFYLFLLLGYGVFISIIFCFLWIIYLFIHMNRMFISENNRFFIAIFVFYSVAFLMDTHIMAGQYFVAHSLFLSCILHRRHLSGGVLKLDF